jgi:hypothetical protein
MENGELRILEIVEKKIDGLREEFRLMRTEVLTSFMQHDASDNKRFAELFDHMNDFRTWQAVEQHKDKEEIGDHTRWHNWQIALFGLIGLLASAVIGAATAHIIGPH